MEKKFKFVCSIYKARPEACKGYPWNHANQIFAECQFLNEEKSDLLTLEELEKIKSSEEIGEYCVECGKCCFFGPAACSKLVVSQF